MFDYFSKCIKINNHFITNDVTNISICHKNTESNKYDILKSIELYTFTSNLLSIDNSSFISTQPEKKKLTLFEFNNFNEILTINNIDCVDYLQCLFNYKNEYIIINCFNGLGLLSIDTKEIIQYIKIKNNSFEKQIMFDDNNLIYLLTENIKNLNIVIFRINNNSFEYIK